MKPHLLSVREFLTALMLASFMIGCENPLGGSLDSSSVPLDHRPGFSNGAAPRLSITSIVSAATDDQANAFAGSTLNGLVWDAGTSALKLGLGGSCDGSTTNCAKLDVTWASQWTSLASYWQFDGTWTDSKASFNLSPSGGASFSPSSSAKVGTASAVFDGSSGCAISNLVTSRSASVSLSAWFKTSNLTQADQTIMHSGLDDSVTLPSNGYGVTLNGNNTSAGHLWVLYSGVTWIDTSLIISDLNWHFVVLTITAGGTPTVSLDGQSVYTGGTSGIIAPTLNSQIGCTSSGSSKVRFFNGQIDEPAIWNTALSSSDILQIYTRQSPRYSATVSSRVFDGGIARAWSNFAWVTPFPSYKELSDNGQSESSADYSAVVGSDGTTATHDLMSGIKGVWHLNEIAGTNGAASVKDSSGNGNHGTPGGSFSFGNSGKLQGSVFLDGSSGSVELGGVLSQIAYTKSAWVKWTGSGAGNMISSMSGTGGSHALFLPGGYLSGFQAGGSRVTDTDLFPINTWTHVAVTYDSTVNSGEMKLYKNGAPVSSAATGVPAPGGSGTALGSYLNSNNFQGLMDEAAIWSRALTANEIKQLYTRGASRLRFQIRACSLADCSDGSWKGTDGSDQTFFSELNNNSIPLTASGTVFPTLPNLLFSAFTSPSSSSRYFQYRAIFEADDIDINLAPRLKKVSVRTLASQVLASYLVKGTCSVNGAGVNVTIGDGTNSAVGSGTCAVGTYEVVVDVSNLNDGTLTANVSSTNNNLTGTASATYSGSNTHVPASATALTWIEGAASTNFIVHAIWTPSISPDLANQLIQFYSGSCAAPIGNLIHIGSALTNTYALTGTNGNTYTYKITSLDSAGNSQTSGCSSALTETSVLTDLARNPPSNVTPGFEQGTYLGTSLLTASDGSTPAVVLNTTTNLAELASDWTPEWSSLLSYYKMNNDWTDSEGSHNGTPQNSAGFTSSGKLGASATFNGTSQYATYGNNFDFTSQNFSFAYWVYYNSLNTNSPGQGPVDLFKGIYQTSGYYSQTGTDGAVSFATNQAGAIQSSGTAAGAVAPGRWYHIAIIRSGASVRVYVNGEDQTSVTATHLNPTSSANDFAIGSYDSGFIVLNGAIDDFAVWSTALTSAEVETLYSRQVARYAGQFTSRPFNYGTPHAWTMLSWLTTLPFGKELPGGGLSENSSDYPLQSANLMSGNQGLWHLNEAALGGGGAGKDFKDGSGNGNWGTKAGGVSLAGPGVLARSPTFDGSSGYVSLGSFSLPWSSPSWIGSISFWAKGSGFAISNYRTGSAINFGWIEINSGAGGFTFSNADTSSAPYSHSISSTDAINTSVWNHYVLTSDGAGHYQMAVNGHVTSLSHTFLGTGSAYDAVTIGLYHNHTYGDAWFTGSMDEVAVWNRALSSAEILEIYRRGANRTKFQLRTCTLPDCSDNPAWLGPSGNNQLYFSELQNNSTLDAFWNPVGNVLTNFPQMLFSVFTSLTVPPRQYFQYRAILESDDVGTACAGAWCSPELKSVTAIP